MNVAVLLTRAASRVASRLALSDGEQSISYGELDGRVARLASGLRSAGLERGDRVAILMRNQPELIESLFAVFRGGFVAVPLNARLHADEIRYIVQHASCSALLYGPGFEGVAQRGDTPITVGPSDWEDLASQGDAAFPDEEMSADDVAWLFYTSGTTGRPKGAMLTHGNLIQMTVACLADLTDYRPTDVVLHAAPLTHGAGLYSLAGIARGALHVVPRADSFDAATLLRLIEHLRVTVISFLTPTMIKRLVDEADRSHDVSSLRSIVYGGGPSYVEDMKQAMERFGRIFAQLYGQGEAPMTITFLPPEDHDRDELLASVGVPHPNVEVRILDEDDHEIARGEIGEICVRGAVVMRGYWKDPDATAETLRGGWLHTGDVGRFDPSGYLYLLDRKKDLIISGGSNIYPREVEEVLLQHPAVAAAAVIGIPDRMWGESVHAIVVVKRGASVSGEDLIEFSKSRMASYKKPRTVEFVSELPVSGHGKILKRDLRTRVSRNQAARSEAGSDP